MTLKATAEALALGFCPSDVRLVLASLRQADFGERLVSSVSGDWLYVFRPQINGVPLYVKIVLRNHCVVVSFHEDDASQVDD